MASHGGMDAERRRKIDVFMGITDSSAEVAERTLEAMNWDVNAALDLFLESEGTRLGVTMEEGPTQYVVKEPDEEDINVPLSRPDEDLSEQQPMVSAAAPPSSFPFSPFFSGNLPRVGNTSFMANPFGDTWGFNHPRPRNVRDIPITGGDDDDNRAVGGLQISEIPMEDENMEERENDPTQGGGSRADGIGRGVKESEGKASAAVSAPEPRDGGPGLGPGGMGVSGTAMNLDDLNLRGYMDPDLQDTEEHMIRAVIEESRKAALQAGGNDEEFNRSFSNVNGDEDLERAVSLSLQTAEQERRVRELHGDSDSQDAILHDEDGDEDPPGGLVRRITHREETRRSTRISETTVHPAGEGPRTRSSVVERSTHTIHRSGGGVGENRRTRGRGGGGEPASNIGPVRSGGVSSSGGGGTTTPGRRRGGPTRKSAGVSGRRGSALLDADVEGAMREIEGDISRDGGRAGGRGASGRVGANGPRGDDIGATGRRNECGAGLMGGFEDDVMAEAENGHEESLGLSSAEHAEAVMLESALFGVPYRGSSTEAEGSASRHLVHTQAPSTLVDNRLLREEQDNAFLASLQADREKEMSARRLEEEMRRIREEGEALERAEQERKREEGRAMLQAAEELERELERKRLALPPEPENGDSSAIYLMVRLPDGSRRGRRFLRQDKLQALYDFIDVSGGVKPGTYRLAQTFPKRLISNGNTDMTLEEAGLLNRQETLFLEWL